MKSTTALNADKPGNFNIRYLSIFVCLFWVGAYALLSVAEGGYDSYQTSQIEERLRPVSIVPVISKDIIEFKARYNRLPENLDEFAALSKAWVINQQRQSRVFHLAGRESPGANSIAAAPLGEPPANKALSALRFRNYIYLYAKIDAETALLWALPEPFIPSGYSETAGAVKAALASSFAAEFRQTSTSYLLVISRSQIRLFTGQTRGKITLEKAARLLQPTPRQLFELGMLEQKLK